MRTRQLVFVFYSCFIFCFALEDDADDNNKTIPSNGTKLGDVQTLIDLENNMKSLITRLFTRASSMFSPSNIPQDASTSCLLSLLRVYFGIKNLEPWAFKLMDSTGKLSGGLLEGTSSALGDYDECLDVVVGGRRHKYSKTGEYCLVEVKPPDTILNAIKDFQIYRGKENNSLAHTRSFLGFLKKIRTNPNHIIFRLGLCMPSACSEEDVQSIVDTVTEQLSIKAEVVRCEYDGGYEFEIHEIIIIIFLSNFVALAVVATIADFFWTRKDCFRSFLEPGPNAIKVYKGWNICKFVEILSEFSINRSIKKLLNCEPKGDALDVVGGIKILTVIFAIYAHTYALPHPLHLYRFRDTLNFSKFVDNIMFSTVANSSVGVDTIFFLAGFLFIYNRWRLLKKPPVLMYLTKFLYVNYTRMLAAQVLVIFIFVLFPLLGSGPLFHEFVEQPLENCANRWWMNVLFIQNFLGPYDSCLYHSWVLATIMQLFLITTVLVWILHRKPVAGLALIVAAIIISIIAVAVVTTVNDFPATFTIYFYDFRTSIKYWKYLYVQTYNHLGPFCIGMLIAYYIAEYPPKKCKTSLNILLWIASVVTCASIVFGLHHYREDGDMNQGLAVFYSALHRPAWAMAMAWMVYACATNKGGFIACIFSWNALIPIERLCFLAYLLHIPLMYYRGGVQRERIYMGHYDMAMCFISYTVMSFSLAFICYLIFQSPYHIIESFIFGRHKDCIWKSDPKNVPEGSPRVEQKETPSIEEDTSRVLYNRYVRNDVF